MSKVNPKFLGRGGRRSLSDIQAGRPTESQGRAVRPPTRTVSLASPEIVSLSPLAERMPVDIHQRRISTSRPITQVENLNANEPARVGSHQQYEMQPRKASGAVDASEQDLDPQIDSSIERRKENVAPGFNQHARVDSILMAKEENIRDEAKITGPIMPSHINSEAADRRCIRDSIDISQRLTNQPNRSTTSLNLPLREDLFYSLQSMYGNPSPELTSNLEFLHAIEEAFDARYTTAFDVFYNTRRFFDGPSGTILDVAAREHPIGAGTLSGKSIYGVFIDDSLLYERSGIVESQNLVPPTLHGTDFFRQSRHQSDIAGLSGLAQRVSAHPKSLTIPTRRLNRPQISESIGYNSLPRRRKVAGRDIFTSPIRLRPTFRVSPPRSPSFGMHKKTSTLRPKAVMAWWKEREAATSQADSFGRGMTRLFFDLQSEKLKTPPLADEPDKKKGKEKSRNPLRRLSSLFGKRQSSGGSLESMIKSNGSHKSLNSLPSQISLPECRQGLPSFITANIVRNSRVPSSVSEIVDAKAARQVSAASSIVKQRISSFEAPRPIRVEKKYQTSPSYQLLNTLKPVRGRSLKEQFEKKIVPGIAQSEGNFPKQAFRDLPGSAWGVGAQRAPVMSPTDSSSEALIPTSQTPVVSTSVLGVPNGPNSSESNGHSTAHPTFVDTIGSEGSGESTQEIYDAEIVLSSPDFSDPQIVTSTPPLRNSGLSSPLVPKSISIFGDSTSSCKLDSSLYSSINSNYRLNKHAVFSGAIDPVNTASVNEVSIQKPANYPDEIYETHASMNTTASDDNKENIAPDDDLPDLPSIPTHNARRRSASNILGFSRSDTRTQNIGMKTEGSLRRQSRGWQTRPLRMVKSALSSFGAKDPSKAIAQDQNGSRKTRPSVRDLFKFSRPVDTTSSNPTPSTPSFRVLPTVGSKFLPEEEVEVTNYKNKSILSMRLGRKKKPILAVPKYSKKDKSRGNIFGIFEFNKIPPKPSFVIHSDEKHITGRKVSSGSNKTISKIARRFSVNFFPIFNRRIFSAPIENQSLPPKIFSTPRERSISPPPQLELTLSGSGL